MLRQDGSHALLGSRHGLGRAADANDAVVLRARAQAQAKRHDGKGARAGGVGAGGGGHTRQAGRQRKDKIKCQPNVRPDGA